MSLKSQVQAFFLLLAKQKDIPYRYRVEQVELSLTIAGLLETESNLNLESNEVQAAIGKELFLTSSEITQDPQLRTQALKIFDLLDRVFAATRSKLMTAIAAEEWQEDIHIDSEIMSMEEYAAQQTNPFSLPSNDKDGKKESTKNSNRLKEKNQDKDNANYGLSFSQILLLRNDLQLLRIAILHFLLECDYVTLIDESSEDQAQLLPEFADAILRYLPSLLKQSPDTDYHRQQLTVKLNQRLVNFQQVVEEEEDSSPKKNKGKGKKTTSKAKSKSKDSADLTQAQVTAQDSATTVKAAVAGTISAASNDNSSTSSFLTTDSSNFSNPQEITIHNSGILAKLQALTTPPLLQAHAEYNPLCFKEAARGFLNKETQQLRNDLNLLIREAPTGTGKSLAYLIPVIFANQRVIVSTFMKSLQEQLIREFPSVKEMVDKVRVFAAQLKANIDNKFKQLERDTSAQGKALYQEHLQNVGKARVELHQLLERNTPIQDPSNFDLRALDLDWQLEHLESIDAMVLKGQNNYLCPRNLLFLENSRLGFDNLPWDDQGVDALVDSSLEFLNSRYEFTRSGREYKIKALDNYGVVQRGLEITFQQEQVRRLLNWYYEVAQAKGSLLRYTNLDSDHLPENTWVNENQRRFLFYNRNECSESSCPFAKTCPYYTARNQAAKSKVLIMNHTLLCLSNNPDLFEKRNAVIVDECHNLPHVLINCSTNSFRYYDMLNTLREIRERILNNEISIGAGDLIQTSILSSARKVEEIENWLDSETIAQAQAYQEAKRVSLPGRDYLPNAWQLGQKMRFANLQAVRDMSLPMSNWFAHEKKSEEVSYDLVGTMLGQELRYYLPTFLLATTSDENTKLFFHEHLAKYDQQLYHALQAYQHFHKPREQQNYVPPTLALLRMFGASQLTQLQDAARAYGINYELPITIPHADWLDPRINLSEQEKQLGTWLLPYRLILSPQQQPWQSTLAYEMTRGFYEKHIFTANRKKDAQDAAQDSIAQAKAATSTAYIGVPLDSDNKTNKNSSKASSQAADANAEFNIEDILQQHKEHKEKKKSEKTSNSYDLGGIYSSKQPKLANTPFTNTEQLVNARHYYDQVNSLLGSALASYHAKLEAELDTIFKQEQEAYPLAFTLDKVQAQLESFKEQISQEKAKRNTYSQELSKLIQEQQKLAALLPGTKGKTSKGKTAKALASEQTANQTATTQTANPSSDQAHDKQPHNEQTAAVESQYQELGQQIRTLTNQTHLLDSKIKALENSLCNYDREIEAIRNLAPYRTSSGTLKASEIKQLMASARSLIFEVMQLRASSIIFTIEALRIAIVRLNQAIQYITRNYHDENVAKQDFNFMNYTSKEYNWAELAFNQRIKSPPSESQIVYAKAKSAFTFLMRNPYVPYREIITRSKDLWGNQVPQEYPWQLANRAAGLCNTLATDLRPVFSRMLAELDQAMQEITKEKGSTESVSSNAELLHIKTQIKSLSQLQNQFQDLQDMLNFLANHKDYTDVKGDAFAYLHVDVDWQHQEVIWYVKRLSAKEPFAELRDKIPNSKWVMTSATIGAGRDFHTFINSLGIRHANTGYVPSPFRHSHNVYFYVDPQKFNNKTIVSKEALEAIFANEGKCLWLCTSNKRVQSIAKELQSKLDAKVEETLRNMYQSQGIHLTRAQFVARMEKFRFTVQMQSSETNKNNLIKQLQNNPRTIVVATRSFWEGVDIKGDSLSLLIIDKYPNPQLNAYYNTLKQIYGERNSLFSKCYDEDGYITFKQGIGRLVRSEHDYGLIMLLDNSKNYYLRNKMPQDYENYILDFSGNFAAAINFLTTKAKEYQELRVHQGKVTAEVLED